MARGDEPPLLLKGAVEEFDNAGVRTGFRQALAQNFGRNMQGVALEQGRRKFHFRHPKVGNRGAERKIVDGNPHHETKGEEGIDQRPPPFGFGRAEMGVDMERLRIERHVGKQHIVHLRDGLRQAVLDQGSDDEILVKNAAALVTRGASLQLIAHPMLPPIGLAAARRPVFKCSFTMLGETDSGISFWDS